MSRKISKKMVLLGVIIIILILLIIVFKYCFKEEKVNNNKNKKETSKEVWLTPQGSSDRINFYYSDEYKNLIIIKDGEDASSLDYSYKNIGIYKCTSKTCKHYDINENTNEVIIKDEDYLIYNYVLNKYKKINISNNEYNKISFMSYENKNYGLAVSDINGMYAFYSFASDKFITDFKYTNVLNEQKNGLPYNRFIATSANENDIYHVINSKTGEELLKTNSYTGIINNGKYLYYYVNYSDDDKIIASIYNSSYELLFDGEVFEQFGVSSKGNLAINRKEEDFFRIYNKYGKLIKSSKKYKNIGIIMNDYIVVVDSDDYVKIVDYDGNVITKFIKFIENYHFNTKFSGFYKENGKNGIYIIIENSTLEYGEEGKILKLYYDLKTKQKQIIKKSDIDI